MILLIILCIALTAIAAYGATPKEHRQIFPHYED